MASSSPAVVHVFPLVETSGSPYELGWQHGTQARELIARRLATIESQASQTLPILRRRARYLLSLIRDVSPAMVEEIRGLADGAHIGFADALLCQSGPETIRDAPPTGVAIAARGPAAGQAMAALWLDVTPETASMLVLLHVRPASPRPAALMLTPAGQLGSWGMNSAGLIVLDTHLPCWPPRPGLPFPPLRRAMLEKRIVADCVSMAKRRYVSSAVAMVAADGLGSVIGLEIHPEAVAHVAARIPGCIAVANHYQCDVFAGLNGAATPESWDRLDRATAVLAAQPSRVSVETLRDIVAGNGMDTRHPGALAGGEETAGLVADPQTGMLYVYRNGHWRSYHV
jgi:isopenicillin-N N-acyltransferase like protein